MEEARVLLVEEDYSHALVTRRRLRAAGHFVILATTTNEALRVLEAMEEGCLVVDVVVADANFPPSKALDGTALKSLLGELGSYRHVCSLPFIGFSNAPMQEYGILLPYDAPGKNVEVVLDILRRLPGIASRGA